VGQIEVCESEVRAVGHDAKQETLMVAYRDGKVWTYWNVPRGLYLELLIADSQAKFLREKIHMRYPGIREI
jgi:hypothetical protein